MSYKQNAQQYHQLGLQVVPVYPFSTIPSIKGAAQFANEAVPDTTVADWQTFHPSFNIGCVTGESSGVAFLRVRTAEPKVSSIIRELMIESPWKMVDGEYTVYCYEHNPSLTPFRIYLIGDEHPLLELCCQGGVQVLPPSIPTFKGEPLASNIDFERGLLSGLPPQFEDLVTGAVSSLGLKLAPKPPEFDEFKAPKGIRNYKLCATAQRLTSDILRGKRTLQESIDILASIAEMVECEDGELEEVLQKLFLWLKDDMVLLGRSLPASWREGLTYQNHPFGDDDTEWDYNMIKDFVYQQLSVNYNNDDKKLISVQETLKRMNQAHTIDEVQEDQLLRYITKQANLGFTMGVLRRQLKNLNTGTCPGENQTEIARAFLGYVSRVCPIVSTEASIYQFTGAHWEAVRDSELAQIIADIFGHLPAAKRASDHYGVLRIMKGWIDGPLRHPKYETSEGINFSNGFLDSDLKLHDHHPDFGATYMMPFEYDRRAADASNRPMFNQFLKDCWGADDDFEDKLKALQEAISITLLGNAYQYQKVFLLFGAPKSGKSQLLNIISSLVPLAAKTSLPPTEWGERFRPAQLHNKILNIAGELSEHRLIEGQIFKDIVDGTEQLAENKGTNFFRFIPKCAHWFASNHMPKTRDTSEGFIRRWQIFTFRSPLPDGAAIIRNLGNIIAAKERQSIVAWALESLPSLHQRGEYTTPISHLEALTDVAGANNSVRFFMTGSGMVEVANRSLKNQIQHLGPEQLKSLPYLTGDVLHNAYLSFALGVGGVRPVSSQRFHQMMAELCPIFGIAQKRIKSFNGLMGFAYFNLKIMVTPVGTHIDMGNSMATDRTDLNDGSTSEVKYQ